MKAIKTNDGIIHLAESKAKCPHCEHNIPFDDIEDVFMNQDDFMIEIDETAGNDYLYKHILHYLESIKAKN